MTTGVSRRGFYPPMGRRFEGAPSGDLWMIRRGGVEGGSDKPRPEPGNEKKLDLQIYVTDKLRELRAFSVDLKDYDSRIQQTLTHEAYRLMDRISDSRTVYPFITPGEDGSVLFEWRAGSERLEIEFIPGEPAYVSHVDADRQVQMRGPLGARGVEVGQLRRSLSQLSSRVWALNPGWRSLFA